MAKLSNIATTKVKVALSVGEVGVKGLSLSNIALLLQDFPYLLEAVSGKHAGEMAEIVARVPGAVVTVLGLTCAEDLDEEDIGNLSVTDSLDLLIGVLNATFPEGITPFLQKIEGLAKTLEKKA